MLDDLPVTDVRRIDAAEANKRYVGKPGNYVPPYPEGSDVWKFKTAADAKFVRVHLDEAEPKGRFLLLSELEFNHLGGDAEAIRQYLRLEKKPAFVTDVYVPAGTEMQAGVVGAQPKLGLPTSSRAIQFELVDKIPEKSYLNTRPIK